MSPSPSTPSGVRICWLFLDSANEPSWCHTIKLSDNQWQYMEMEEFVKVVLSAEMRKWFGFRPELSTLGLWIVS